MATVKIMSGNKANRPFIRLLKVMRFRTTLSKNNPHLKTTNMVLYIKTVSDIRLVKRLIVTETRKKAELALITGISTIA
jgi:hypothetical protein